MLSAALASLSLVLLPAVVRADDPPPRAGYTPPGAYDPNLNPDLHPGVTPPAASEAPLAAVDIPIPEEAPSSSVDETSLLDSGTEAAAEE